MHKTPLKNSKSVNQPFKSPFNVTICNKDKKKTNDEILQGNCEKSAQSPVKTRNLEAKRILLLGKNENKRRKTSNDDKRQTEKIEMLVPENATKIDLYILKRQIFEIRQELDRLKSRKSCAKKHDPKELKNSIHKWKSVCQNSLQIISSELKENGQNSKISDILHNLGIPETLVQYSNIEEAFV